jgi:hypothetical protein
MSRSLVEALVKLLEGAVSAQSQTCRVSAFTTAQRQALEDLGRRTGALRVRTEGRGSVYQVVNRDILSSHLQHLRPQHADDIDPSIPRRAANIAQSRSSKGRSHGHELHYLLIKSIAEGVIWRDQPPGEGPGFDLSQVTQTAGAGVLALREEDAWCSEEPLWLVENQALFDRLDWLPSGSRGTVAYYAGQLPGRLLNWLAHRPRASQVIIFPDYDGVGLLNYARLLEKSRSPCTFWLMPDWRFLLGKYGSHVVWQNTQSDFQAAYPRLKAAGAPAGVLELCVELSRQGLALEHESVWLNTPLRHFEN